MTLAQVRRELEPQGFTFKESLEFLPWQHVIIFEKPADPEKPADSKTRDAPRKGGAPQFLRARETIEWWIPNCG